MATRISARLNKIYGEEMPLQEETVSSMYGRLFRLPRLSVILLLGAVCSVVLSLLLVSALSPLISGGGSLSAFTSNLLTAISFFFGSFLLSAELSNRVFMGNLPGVMNFRRTLGVSLFSLLFTTGIFIVGWILYVLFSIRLLVWYIAFSFVSGLTIRLLVDLVVMTGRAASALLDAIIQPLLNSAILLLLLGANWYTDFMIRFLIVSTLFVIFTTVYVHAIGLQLKRLTGVDGRVFFNSFLSEWGAGLGEQLEKIIARNSIDKDLKIACLSFRNKRGKPKAVLLVPTVHPGPFRGVGSSNLPSYLMRRLERDFRCPVVCAHGPSTHGENLVSSSQNELIYREAVRILDSCITHRGATPLREISEGGVSVACQIFGDFGLLIGGCSSQLPMDDISLDVGEEAVVAAKKSVEDAFLIDSHSCIDPESDYIWLGSKAGKLLAKLAQRVTKEASAFHGKPFGVGASKIRSTGLSRAEGMGEEGVGAIVVQVSGEEDVYLFFDSNNMVPSLRDTLLRELRSTDLVHISVLTSDTHSTSALTPGKLGYNPLGYSTPHKKIVQLALSAVELARKDIEDADVCVGIDTMRSIRVAGEENMQNILKGTRDSLRVAKRLAPITFGLPTLLAIALAILF